MVPVVGLDGLCPSFAMRTPIMFAFGEGGFESLVLYKKITDSQEAICYFGAGGGTRTHTMSPSTDFESASSANSNTPAKTPLLLYYILSKKAIQKSK